MITAIILDKANTTKSHLKWSVTRCYILTVITPASRVSKTITMTEPATAISPSRDHKCHKKDHRANSDTGNKRAIHTHKSPTARITHNKRIIIQNLRPKQSIELLPKHLKHVKDCR